jgi:carboxypeptidase C (cathepsin A)
MAEATPPAAAPDNKTDTTADGKLRRAVEQLLARPPAVSSGTVLPAGRSAALRYTARVEFLPVMAQGFDGVLGEPQAAVVATSYQRLPDGDGQSAVDRPVCFAFNGGPGSASIWLHLGALGPKRMVVPDDGSAARAPFLVQDNPLTWLEHFDLVFIDPPHTGWSVSASETARKRMLGVDGDVEALTEVVRVWLSRHQRWGSPVYLAGESYGTTRGAALADALQVAGVSLDGLVLISCAMDLQTLEFNGVNELPYGLFLPAFALVSQYHGLLKGSAAASPTAARQAAEAFVDETYVSALHAGNRLDARRQSRLARHIADLTGLPQPLVEAHNLRISDQTYFFEAMRSQGRMVGRLDARATGPMGATRGRSWEFDPGIEAIAPAYTAAALSHFSQTLGVQLEQRFEVLSHATHKAWNWNRGDGTDGGYASTTADLARALRRNPNLRVLVASGRYDLGTPYSATDWSLAHLDVPPDVASRITHHYYDAGHMMYTRSEDLAALKTDLAAWLAA